MLRKRTSITPVDTIVVYTHPQQYLGKNLPIFSVKEEKQKPLQFMQKDISLLTNVAVNPTSAIYSRETLAPA